MLCWFISLIYTQMSAHNTHLGSDLLELDCTHQLCSRCPADHSCCTPSTQSVLQELSQEPCWSSTYTRLRMCGYSPRQQKQHNTGGLSRGGVRLSIIWLTVFCLSFLIIPEVSRCDAWKSEGNTPPSKGNTPPSKRRQRTHENENG